MDKTIKNKPTLDEIIKNELLNGEEEYKTLPRHKSDKNKDKEGYKRCLQCGKYFQRNNVTQHRRTNYHKIYAQIMDNFLSYILI